MWVASASIGTVLCSVTTRVVRRGLADHVDADVDGDLLAPADEDQVDVLDEALDRVALDLLGQGELLLPSSSIDSRALAPS